MTKLKMLATTAALMLATSTSAFATECIAPANAGGGWDFTCRQVGKMLYDLKLVDTPVQVTNMAGAGGGLAFAHVVADMNTNPDVIVAASSSTTTRLAQKAFGDATADQVRWVGAIAGDPGVIVVAKDSPFQNLNDMIDAIKKDPSSVAFAGGSAAGGFDHMKPLQVLKAAGFTDIAKIKYIGVDGGADAITQTIGGFT
ncbi:MAG: tripartite tricarboxylate transporter substrate-binding protein, partial [Cypionkella sp.]